MTVLKLLEAIYLRLRKILVESVTVVKVGVDNRGSDGTDCIGLQRSSAEKSSTFKETETEVKHSSTDRIPIMYYEPSLLIT